MWIKWANIFEWFVNALPVKEFISFSYIDFTLFCRASDQKLNIFHIICYNCVGEVYCVYGMICMFVCDGNQINNKLLD
jgi:hypothetical protein